MVCDIRILVETIKCKKHIVHDFDRWFTDAIWFIWHNTLDKRSDSLVLIRQKWSHNIYQLDLDIFVWSICVTVIEIWRIYKCHIASLSNFHTCGYRFKRLAGLELTCPLLLSPCTFICIESCNLCQNCRFALSTLTKDASCKFIDIQLNFSFCESIAFKRS